jgi:peptidoglycan/LPS O-acetylase OafA/YrhL/lysophospholipase L1-like esterase
MWLKRKDRVQATEKLPVGISSGGPKLPYLPGLDGLRALAVIGVVLYHAGFAWIPGGFLGVEVFFVISGYLITSLLITEWQGRGSINLKAFWLRRARRLLPALYMLLLAVVAFAVIFLPEEVAGLRRDVLAALGYVTNWALILRHQSYFESVGRPPLLQHLWSLAVEEQFYVFWPLIFMGLMGLFRTRKRAMWAVLGAAAVSSLWMAILYRPDLDPSRVYYGTDTRASGLLIGAALAFIWLPVRRAAPFAEDTPRTWRARLRTELATDVIDLAGLAALAALVVLYTHINEYQSFLYRGGFTLVGLATLGAIAVAVHPRGRVVPRLLGWGPLRWIGLRSYGIYLWHWPVFQVTRPQLDLPLDGLPLLALRLSVTLVLVELSYRFVEVPVRKGALERAWQAWREARGVRRRWLGLRWTAAAALVVVLAVALGNSVVSAQPPATPSYLQVTSVDTVDAPPGAPHAAPAPAPVASSKDPTTQTTSTVSGTLAATDGAAWWNVPFCSLNPMGVFAVSRATSATTTLPVVAPPAPSSAQRTVDSPTPVGVDGVDRLAPADRRPPQTHGGAPASPLASPTPPAQPLPTAASPLPTPTAGPTQAPVVVSAPAAGATISNTTPPATATPVVAHQVTAIGDSVMLGAVPQMEKAIGDVGVDAAVGRQVSTAIATLQQRQAAHQLGPVIVIHLGSNGTFTAKQFDTIMGLLSGEQRVIFLTAKVPRSWEGPNNTVITEGVKRYPNAVLVDWKTASADHPEYFWGDGIHLRPEGAQVYADMIAAAVKAP